MTSETLKGLEKAVLKDVNELKSYGRKAQEAVCDSHKNVPDLVETLKRIEEKVDSILKRLDAKP